MFCPTGPERTPRPDSLTTELVAQGFDFPTSVAFADDRTLYVAESGLPFGGARPGGRIIRVEADGRRTVVLDGLRQPVNGLTWHAGGFYIAEGGFPGRISRWVPGAAPQTILDGLPGRGNYHTNMIAVGPDGWLYFGQGAMTNSGVVGLDAYDLAWLKTLPHPFDVPGYDIELAGQTFETDDPTAGGRRRARRRPLSRRSATRRHRARASPAVCRARRRCCAAARTARHSSCSPGACAMPMVWRSCPTDGCSRPIRAPMTAARARSAMRRTCSTWWSRAAGTAGPTSSVAAR